MNRGEAWWVSTRNGRRPYVIVTRQTAIPLLGSLLAIPATTTVRGAPSEVPLDEDDGMPRECVLACDNLELVGKPRFIRHICTLNGERLDEVCHTLAIATGCRD